MKIMKIIGAALFMLNLVMGIYGYLETGITAHINSALGWFSAFIWIMISISDENK